jgi:hypothetical protein
MNRGKARYVGIADGKTIYVYTDPKGAQHTVNRPFGSKRWHGVPLDYMNDCHRALALCI